jgi:CRISPR-associated exonuclease Cas4
VKEFLPISALQHLLFCERQCALIHLDRLWVENRMTAEGRQLHSKVHAADGERRVDRRIVRGLELSSERLELYGVADVVEFEDGKPPRPIEYKRGRPKSHAADAVQHCAQAMSLEEMLSTDVPEGSLFYSRNTPAAERPVRCGASPCDCVRHGALTRAPRERCHTEGAAGAKVRALLVD